MCSFQNGVLVMRLATLMLGLAALLACLFPPSTKAEDGSTLALYSEGYYGVGHNKWHDIYEGMHNQNDVLCCHSGDCRPSSTKVENGRLYVKVNGEWLFAPPNSRVKEYPYSWSETAHVCTMFPADRHVICVAPEGPGT